MTSARLKKLKRMSPKAYAAEVRRLRDRYLDEGWREAELLWRREHASSYKLEAQAAQALFPKGTARDYARIMTEVLRGSFLSPEASERDALASGMADGDPGQRRELPQLRDKGGALAGVLTEAMYFTPKRGDFGGTPHVSVLFLRNLPADAFASLRRPSRTSSSWSSSD